MRPLQLATIISLKKVLDAKMERISRTELTSPSVCIVLIEAALDTMGTSEVDAMFLSELRDAERVIRRRLRRGSSVSSKAVEGTEALGTSGTRGGADGVSCREARLLAGPLLASPADPIGVVGEGGGLSVEEATKPVVDAGDAAWA